jgi:hypothetical protein
VGLAAAPAAPATFLAGCISSSSSSSSNGLFLLRVVVVDALVAVEVLRAALALAAAVTTRVGFAAGAGMFAAALARVILLGGDSASIVGSGSGAAGFIYFWRKSEGGRGNGDAELEKRRNY